MNLKLSDHFNYHKLLRFTLPSMAMMIFTSIYGVVDGFFVSNYAGKAPFAAVNLIIPFLMITATVGFMFGTGGSAVVAFTFGTGDKEKANQLFSLFVYVSLALGVLFAVFGILFLRPISVCLGAQGAVLEDCVVYGRILLLALPFYVLQLLFQSFFVAAEKPQLSLAVTVTAGIANMVLDAVLVVWLPQDLKLAGAAVATAASQVIGGVVPLIYFFCANSSPFRLGKTVFDRRAVRKACLNGSSEFMSNIAMSIVSMLFNRQLLRYAGESGVVAYGVMMYVSMIFAAAFIGYSIGVAPIISFHDGAKNHSELRNLLRRSLLLVSCFAVGMTAAAELFAVPLAHIFVGYEKELMDLTVSGFRIFAVSFLFMGFAIFASGFFTALNDGLTSALISFLRTFVFEIAAVLVLPLLFGINGIWISVVIAEVMAALLSAIFLIGKRKTYHYF